MTKQNKQSAEAAVREICRRTRRKFSPGEKIRIVLEGLRGEQSVSVLCRREGSRPLRALLHGLPRDLQHQFSRQQRYDPAQHEVQRRFVDLHQVAFQHRFLAAGRHGFRRRAGLLKQRGALEVTGCDEARLDGARTEWGRVGDRQNGASGIRVG
jgi:hypothetical protein